MRYFTEALASAVKGFLRRSIEIHNAPAMNAIISPTATMASTGRTKAGGGGALDVRLMLIGFVFSLVLPAGFIVGLSA